MRRSRRNLLVAIAVADVVLLAAIAAVWASRQPPPPPVTPGPPLSPPAPVALSPDASPAWDGRLAPDAGADPACEGCNVLLVSLDIFRPDHLGCFGYARDTMPTLCELAARGTVFENYTAHAYQTPISMMSMLTGRYPSSTGFTNFSAVLPPEVAYAPESFAAAGYTTVAMGSSFEVMTDMSSLQAGALRFTKEGLNPGLSFGRGFDRFVFTGLRNVPDDALGWLADHRDQKFFLWLVLGTLHWPYGQHGDLDEQRVYDPRGYAGPLARFPQLGFEVLSRIYDRRLYLPEGQPPTALDDADAAYINGRYDVGLRVVDRFLRALLASMPPEQLQKTVIVLHGVHGEDLGEHRYFGHYDLYDTEVKNLLVVLSPKRRAEGVRIAAPVEGVDLAPTLLDLVGLPAMPGVEGRSLRADIRDGGSDPDRATFTERIPLWEDIFRHRSLMPGPYVERVAALLDREVVGDTAIRTSRWKLVHRRARDVEAQVSWWAYVTGAPMRRPAWELYDLRADPTEQHDVAAAEPAVRVELATQLLAWEAKVGMRAVDTPDTPP